MSNVTSNFQIAGMTCDACQKVVQKKLSKVADVENVTVDKEAGTANILSNRIINTAEVTAALEGTHYSLVE